MCCAAIIVDLFRNPSLHVINIVNLINTGVVPNLIDDVGVDDVVRNSVDRVYHLGVLGKDICWGGQAVQFYFLRRSPKIKLSVGLLWLCVSPHP